MPNLTFSSTAKRDRRMIGSAKRKRNGTKVYRLAATDATVLATAGSVPTNSSFAQFVQANVGLGIRLTDEESTTIAMQRYLGQLAQVGGSTAAEPIIRALIDSAVSRLHLLCRTLLVRSYPRLARPPLNLQSEELLSAIVNRLLRALQQIRPTTVRQFFALANRHMRWALNDFARRLDQEPPMLAIPEQAIASVDTSESELTPNTLRILEAIESLPDEDREVFDLVRVQGFSHVEAAGMLHVSTKTVQRRLNHSLLLLTSMLSDLEPSLAQRDED